MSVLEKVKFFFKDWFEIDDIYEYSQEVEDLLQELLKEDDVEIIDRYYVRIGDYKLWWSNHPYASFCIGERVGKRFTRHKLMQKVQVVVEKQKDEEFQKH